MTLATGPLRRQASGCPPLCYPASSAWSSVNLPVAGVGLCPRAPSRWRCPDQTGGEHSGSGGYVASSGSPWRLRAPPGVEFKAFSPKPQVAAGCSPRSVPCLPWHKPVFSPLSSFPGRAVSRLCPWPAALPSAVLLGRPLWVQSWGNPWIVTL